MFVRLLVSYFCLGQALSAVIPIAKLEPGTRYRPDAVGAKVKLEVFLDLHCPDSSDAWPHLKELAKAYDRREVDLIVHQFPLPYHQYASMAAEGFYLVREYVNETCAFRYMDSVLDRWYMFTPFATETKTTLQMKSLLADLACQVLGARMTRTEFINYIDLYRRPTVVAWKYAVKRGVAGTPWYFLNGVDLGISYALSYNDLRELIDPLLN